MHDNLLGSSGWQAVDAEAFTFAAGGIERTYWRNLTAKDWEVFK